jgi:2-keto-3-deoxy-L-rhamnonate aldolase RhmA
VIELLQITDKPELAALCDEIGSFRLFVDWETHGKAERQAGRNSFISTHSTQTLAEIAKAAPHTPVMVRVNPLHEGTAAEVDAAIAGGAKRLMLPMFRNADTVHAFSQIVANRLPITPLLEHIDAAGCLPRWIDAQGVDEVYIGLNDLHISMEHSFMYQPLAIGLVDELAWQIKAANKRFGFGGIARMSEGELAGRRVLGEHMRLGSSAVIVSRTFHGMNVGGDSMASFRTEVAALRQAERELKARSAAQVEADRLQACALIEQIAEKIARSKKPAADVPAGAAS